MSICPRGRHVEKDAVYASGRDQRRPLPWGALVGLLCGVAAWALHQGGLLHALELRSYDQFLASVQPVRSPALPLTLIGVGEADIQGRGHWPLSDGELADLLGLLERAGALAIGVDIYRDLPVSPGSDRLRRTLERYTNIYAVSFLGDGEDRIEAPEVLRSTDRVAASDLLVDGDGRVRRGLMFLDDGRTVYPSLAMRLATAYLSSRGIYPLPDPAHPERMRLGEAVFSPLEALPGAPAGSAGGFQFLLDYGARWQGVRRLALREAEATLGPGDLRGQVVLVGVDATSVKDRFGTPIRTGRGGSLSGAMLHALAADQIVRSALGYSTPRHPWAPAAAAAWIVVWGVAGGLVAAMAPGLRLLAPAWFAGAAVLLGLSVAAFRLSWPPLAAPLLAWTLALAAMGVWHGMQGWRDRRAIMSLFASHVSAEVARDLWARRREFMERGRLVPVQTTATVLFADVRGYTRVASRMGAAAVLEWLNRHLEVLVSEVMERGGMVDDFYGDGLKANFGVPGTNAGLNAVRSQARAAVGAALAIRRRLQELNAAAVGEGPPLQLRIGIETGPVVAGSIGAAGRLKYTTVGDTVNRAARLEAWRSADWEWDAADGDCRILIGPGTASLLPAEIRLQALGPVRLKGQPDPVEIYRVAGQGPGGSADVIALSARARGGGGQ